MSAAGRIGVMLSAILEKQEEEYIDHFISSADGPQISDDVERLKAEIENVRDRLYDSHLQQRYDLKKSSKAPSFTSIDWDIKIKHFDAKLSDFKPFPYATCRLSYQREFDQSPLTLFGRAFDAVQINLSVDEIDYLSRVLATIRERLISLEGEK